MNTRINYLYRDAGNYKVHNEAVICGEMTAEQEKVIMDSLDEGIYFIPRQVGLEGRRFDSYDPSVDHPWFEWQGYELTEDAPTAELTAEGLTEAFTSCKGQWKPTD